MKTTPSDKVETGESNRRRWWSEFSVLALFVALTALMLYPYPRQAATHLRDLGDPLEYAWVLGYSARKLLTDPLHLFDANIYYPFEHALAYSDATIASTITMLPVLLATDNPVLASNLLVMLSFVLAGFGTYLLVADLTGSRLAGVLAGIVFAFNPTRMDHISQVPNTASHWMPFVFWALRRYLVGSRSWRWAVTFGLCLGLQLLSSFYYAYAISLAIAVYLVGYLVGRPRSLFRPSVLLPLLAAVAAPGALLFATSLPYFEVSERYGMHRSLQSAEYYAARLESYLGVAPFNRTWGKVEPMVRRGAPEKTLFPGLVAGALATLGLFGSKPRGEILLFAAVGLVALAVSLGPSPGLTAAGPPLALPFPAPYTLLFDYVPGFPALRVPARFAIVVMLAVATLAGIGAARALRWAEGAITPDSSPEGQARGAASPGPARESGVRAVPPPLPEGEGRSEVAAPRAGSAKLNGARARYTLAGLLAALALAEYASFPLTMEPVPTGAAVPEVYRWLRDQPDKQVLVELPIGDQVDQAAYSYFAAYHGWTIVNGWRSFSPPAYAELATVLQTFPSRQSVDVLADLGVRYVVVHADLLPDWAISRRDRRITAYGDQVKLVRRFGVDYVYEVAERNSNTPSPPALQVSAVSPCIAEPGGTFAVDLTFDSSDRRLVVLSDPPPHLTVTARWTAEDGGQVTQALTVPGPDRVLRAGQARRLTLTAPAEPGVYQLALDLSPALGAVSPRRIRVEPPGSSSADTGQLAVQVVRVELPRQAIRVTDALPLRITWRALGVQSSRQIVFVNLYDAQYRVWTMASQPVAGEPFDGQARCDGDEVLDVREVRLARDAPPGYYWVELGLMDPATGRRQRILAPDGRAVDKVTAGPVRVSKVGVYPADDVWPEHRTGALLGGQIRLLGWTGLPARLQPGQPLRLLLYWMAATPPSASYSVFVHLYDAAGRLVAQRDGLPGNGAWPTSHWQSNDVVEDVVELAIPPGLPPGEYTLAAGLYDLATMRRLPLVEGPGLGDDRVLLGRLVVKGKP